MLLYLRWPSLFMFTKCFANFFTKSSKSSKFRLKESTSMQALEMPKSLRFLKTKKSFYHDITADLSQTYEYDRT